MPSSGKPTPTSGRRRVDFSPYAASVIILHLFQEPFATTIGCGASALALLTGEAPEGIVALNGRPHYSDRFMLRFLRARGFRLRRLCPQVVTRAKRPIGEKHVILVSQLFKPEEGTWGVVFGGRFYHHFEAYSFDSLSLLNKPLMSAYLVTHDRWRPRPKPERPPKPKRRVRHRGFRLGNLQGPKSPTPQGAPRPSS
jgi:hypothetical protein